MITIQGIGQTKYGELWDMSLSSLIQEATDNALDDANLSITDIDEVIFSNMLGGEISAQSHLGAVFTSLYGNDIPSFRVEAACASGGIAVRQAIQSLSLDSNKKILVIGVEKMTDTSHENITRLLMQAASSEEIKASMTFPALFGMMARAYTDAYGLVDSDRAIGSVLMHHNACGNDRAQFQKAIRVEDVLNSPVVADPLRVFDAAPISDGACAIVLSKDTSGGNVSILKSSTGMDSLGLQDREDIISIRSTQRAIEQLLDGTSVSREDIAVMEIHDCFSISSIMAVEDMGFCDKGSGADFLHDIYQNNPSRINPSGGLKACGHPVGASGVRQIAAVALELQKLVTKSKSSDTVYGLTHNLGGTGATCVMHLLKLNS